MGGGGVAMLLLLSGPIGEAAAHLVNISAILYELCPWLR